MRGKRNNIEIYRAAHALICLSNSSSDANDIICEMFPEVKGEDTVERLKAKNNILKIIFGIDPTIGRDSHSNESDFSRLATDYYSFIATCILRKSKFVGLGLLEKEEEALKVLISNSNIIEEADLYLEKYFPNYKGETEQIWKEKYEFILRIFDLEKGLDSKENDTFENLYKTLLSNLILQF